MQKMISCTKYGLLKTCSGSSKLEFLLALNEGEPTFGMLEILEV